MSVADFALTTRTRLDPGQGEKVLLHGGLVALYRASHMTSPMRTTSRSTFAEEQAE